MSGRTRALVVGESLVDIISTSDGRSVHPGGSPLNVAFGLGRLAVPTELLTEFGDDAYGTLLAEHLRSAGVGVIRRRAGSARPRLRQLRSTQTGPRVIPSI